MIAKKAIVIGIMAVLLLSVLVSALSFYTRSPVQSNTEAELQLNERLNSAVDACLSSLPNGTPECDTLLKIKTEEICKNINKLDVCHDGKVTQYYSIRNETKGMTKKSQLG